MKVLFLDIDGVLNCDTTTERIGGDGPYRAMHGLDARLVKLFLEWWGERDVHIVLSSTWRLEHDLLMKVINAGIIPMAITPNLGQRGKEVDRMLKLLSDVTHYAILDDIAQFSAAQLPHFVQTSYAHGLRPKDLAKVDRILGFTKEKTDDAD